MRCISRAKSAALVCVASISLFTGGCIGGKGATPVTAYELKNYNQDLYQGKLYAEELCVAQNDVALEGYTEDTELHSAALFDLTGERVLYSYKAHERLYPASTTKIMTALLAIENANLDDQVTISGNADASSFRRMHRCAVLRKEKSGHSGIFWELFFCILEMMQQLQSRNM